MTRTQISNIRNEEGIIYLTSMRNFLDLNSTLLKSYYFSILENT